MSFAKLTSQGGKGVVINPMDVVGTSLSMTEEIQMCISSIGNQLSWFAWTEWCPGI